MTSCVILEPVQFIARVARNLGRPILKLPNIDVTLPLGIVKVHVWYTGISNKGQEWSLYGCSSTKWLIQCCFWQNRFAPHLWHISPCPSSLPVQFHLHEEDVKALITIALATTKVSQVLSPPQTQHPGIMSLNSLVCMCSGCVYTLTQAVLPLYIWLNALHHRQPIRESVDSM